MAAKTLSLISRSIPLLSANRPLGSLLSPTTLRCFSSTSKLDRMLFTRSHEYVNLTNDNRKAKIGISDHAQWSIGDVIHVEFLKAKGQQTDQGAILCTIESVKAAADTYMPISAKILSINTLLEDDPFLVNVSPYEEGWLVEVEVTKPSELDGLMTEDDYNKYLAKRD